MAKDHHARARISTIEATLLERDRRNTERFDGQQTANKIALDAAKEATLKAEAASEKRFDGVNEFRRTLSDQAASFATRAEMEAKFDGVNNTLKRLEAHDATNAGRGFGMSQLWGYIAGAVGMVVALIAVGVSIFK